MEAKNKSQGQKVCEIDGVRDRIKDEKGMKEMKRQNREREGEEKSVFEREGERQRGIETKTEGERERGKVHPKAI